MTALQILASTMARFEPDLLPVILAMKTVSRASEKTWTISGFDGPYIRGKQVDSATDLAARDGPSVFSTDKMLAFASSVHQCYWLEVALVATHPTVGSIEMRLIVFDSLVWEITSNNAGALLALGNELSLNGIDSLVVNTERPYEVD